MKTYKLKLVFVAICASLFFVACDDDENGNVIELETCDDGIQNGDEEGVDCGGSACAPCGEMLDFSGNYTQEDHMGRPGINTVFGGSAEVKNNFNISTTSGRASFQPTFQGTLELYHDVYADALMIPREDLDYETNILGLDAATFTTVLAQFDALQVAPQGQTAYFIPGGVALTGRRLQDDVIDVSLTLMFGGTTGTRFDGNNGTPQLTSDGVGSGDRDFTLPFPYLETPNN
jgi:hypothetical protein